MPIAARFLSARSSATVPGAEAGDIRELAHRTLWVLPEGVHDLRALRGGLWITQDGDPRDIVLEAGQSLQTAARGRTVVYALSDARFAVRPARPAPARRSARRAWGKTRNHPMALG